MSDSELYSDYWSLDEYLEQNEKITEKCLWLHNVKNMASQEIAKTVGITSSRAKEIISNAEQGLVV